MQDTTSMIIQQSDRQRTKMDGPEPLVLWDQANGLTSQGLAEIDSVPFPLDLSIGTHFADCHSDLVLRYADSTRIGPKRRSVMTGRRLLFQRLVWPLLVVSPAKGVKGTLLDVPVRSRRSGRLRLQRPMQSLKSSVLLRVAGFDPLRYDAQLDPPYRQRRQAPQSNTGEGRPVVGPDGPRKSVLPKGSLQNPLCLRPVGSRQPIAGQQVPRGGVLHGQRVDPDTISCAEPPLPVDGPDVVGALGSSEGFAPGRSMPASFSPLHQPCPFQDIPGGAGRRPRLLWFQRSQPCHQLLGSPGRISKPGSDQPLSNSLRGPIGTATRSSTAVPQSIPAPLLKPPHSLIAGLATDAELTAQLHEAHSPLLPSLDKVDLLGFRPLLFPGQHIPPDGIAPIFFTLPRRAGERTISPFPHWGKIRKGG